MSDPTRIEELRKEIESLCGNCDRPDKEQLEEIILSSMALGFNYGINSDRPQGEWIYIDDDEWLYDSYRCSACKKEFAVDAKRRIDIGFVIEDLEFCPNCGAEMKGADDE